MTSPARLMSATEEGISYVTILLSLSDSLNYYTWYPFLTKYILMGGTRIQNIQLFPYLYVLFLSFFSLQAMREIDIFRIYCRVCFTSFSDVLSFIQGATEIELFTVEF